MKKRILCILLPLVLLLSACSAGQSSSASGEDEGARLTILTATYPLYLFASAVTEGVEGVAVERLDTGSVSCLHDYTLSVNDMKKIEGADVIAINGVGLEDFMEDALAASNALVIDCSEGVELLENPAHDHLEGDEDGHDHGHFDPHIWMDPANAAIMVENLAQGLAQTDPANQESYLDNALDAQALMRSWDDSLRDLLGTEGVPEISGLITFHDGFQYFAKAFDLPLLTSIEEEEGSEASAKEITEITRIVKEYQIPVIFTEVNGSDATAQAIARETGCRVSQLTMLMDGPGDGLLSHYLDGLMDNVIAIVNGFAGEELVR